MDSSADVTTAQKLFPKCFAVNRFVLPRAVFESTERRAAAARTISAASNRKDTHRRLDVRLLFDRFPPIHIERNASRSVCRKKLDLMRVPEADPPRRNLYFFTYCNFPEFHAAEKAFIETAAHARDPFGNLI